MSNRQDAILDKTHWDKLPAANHATQSEKEINDAYERGYQQGIADTKSSIETRNQQVTEELALQKDKKKLISDFLDKFHDEKIHLTSSLQDACVIIIKKIVENEVKKALSTDIAQLKHAIHDALSQLMAHEAACLHLHPEVYIKLADEFTHTDITLKQDASLDIFDFYVTQGDSSVDGQLSHRIEQSIHSLMDKA